MCMRRLCGATHTTCRNERHPSCSRHQSCSKCSYRHSCLLLSEARCSASCECCCDTLAASTRAVDATSAASAAIVPWGVDVPPPPLPRCVECRYMLTVGFQRGTSATQVMHLPLPVTAPPAPDPGAHAAGGSAAPIAVLCMAGDGLRHTQGCSVSSLAVDAAAHARRHSRAYAAPLRAGDDHSQHSTGAGAGAGASDGSGDGGGSEVGAGVDALEAGLARALGRRRRA